jgi:hypothetical protein
VRRTLVGPPVRKNDNRSIPLPPSCGKQHFELDQALPNEDGGLEALFLVVIARPMNDEDIFAGAVVVPQLNPSLEVVMSTAQEYCYNGTGRRTARLSLEHRIFRI